MPHSSVVARGPKSCLAASYGVKETEIPVGVDCRSGSKSGHSPGPQPLIHLGDLNKLPQPLEFPLQPHPSSTLQPREDTCLASHCDDLWEQTGWSEACFSIWASGLFTHILESRHNFLIKEEGSSIGLFAVRLSCLHSSLTHSLHSLPALVSGNNPFLQKGRGPHLVNMTFQDQGRMKWRKLWILSGRRPWLLLLQPTQYMTSGWSLPSPGPHL